MKEVLFLCLTVFVLETGISQTRNYVTINNSFAFFGSGDASGSSLGLSYVRLFSSKFGVQLSLKKSTSKSNSLFQIKESEGREIVNAEIFGDSPVSSMSIYHSYNLGLTYQVSGGKIQTLLVSAGLNYKSLNQNKEGWVLDGDVTEILTYQYYSSKEFGPYVNIDYMINVSEDISIGLHLSTETSSNIVSYIGLNLGYRF